MRRVTIPVGRGRAAILVAAVAYAALAALTTPFTVVADVVTALPCAALAAVVVAQYVSPGTGPWRRLDRPVDTDGDAGTVVPWVAVVAVLVASELASYFAGAPRAAHPTISSGIDALFRWRPAKAAAFFGWLVGGAYLVRR